MRPILGEALILLAAAAAAGAADLRVAAFSADVTPKAGEPLIWTTPAATFQDPLWAKGVVLESGGVRVVLCALDWCGVGNRTHLLFRRKLAEAVGTPVERVSVHTVHQHTAPYVDSSAYDLLRQAGIGGNFYSDASLEEVAGRVAAAAREAAGKLAVVDRVGTAAVRVERVASARRLPAPGGGIAVRYSNSGKQKEMADAPEGAIDPYLRTVTLARGDRPVVRLHYYATHPQTFCCEGTVTGDIAGTARNAREREEKVPQVYFNGAGGDVTVGKYNDGSEGAREQLAARHLDALRRSAKETRYEAAGALSWESAPLRIPKRTPAEGMEAQAPVDTRYRRAIGAVFARRTEPLTVSILSIGKVPMLYLPGEPLLEFQKYAESLRPGGFVAFAGYGDVAPGYICTDVAYREGGYEPSASNTGPGAEAAVKAVIRELLER